MAEATPADERGQAYVLRHRPPPGISFVGVGRQPGRLCFVVMDHCTKELSGARDGYDFHVPAEVESRSELVQLEAADDGQLEVVSVDYGRLLICVYLSHLPG